MKSSEELPDYHLSNEYRAGLQGLERSIRDVHPEGDFITILWDKDCMEEDCKHPCKVVTNIENPAVISLMLMMFIASVTPSAKSIIPTAKGS